MNWNADGLANLNIRGTNIHLKIILHPDAECLGDAHRGSAIIGYLNREGIRGGSVRASGVPPQNGVGCGNWPCPDDIGDAGPCGSARTKSVSEVITIRIRGVDSYREYIVRGDHHVRDCGEQRRMVCRVNGKRSVEVVDVVVRR